MKLVSASAYYRFDDDIVVNTEEEEDADVLVDPSRYNHHKVVIGHCSSQDKTKLMTKRSGLGGHGVLSGHRSPSHTLCFSCKVDFARCFCTMSAENRCGFDDTNSFSCGNDR